MNTKNEKNNKDSAAASVEKSLLNIDEYESINGVLGSEMKGVLKFRGKLGQYRLEMGELINSGEAKARLQKVKGGAKLYNKWLVKHGGLDKAELKECKAIGKLCYETFKEDFERVGRAYPDTVEYSTLKLGLGKYSVLKKIKEGKSKKVAPNLRKLEFLPGQILVVLPNGDTYDLAELTFAELAELLKPVIDTQVTGVAEETKPGSKDALRKEIAQLRLQRDYARTIIKLRMPEEYDAILANETALGPDVLSELSLNTSVVDIGDKEEEPADTADASLVVVADCTKTSEIVLDKDAEGAALQVHGRDGQDSDDVLPAVLDPDMAQENSERNEDSIDIEEIPMDNATTVDEGNPVMPWKRPIAKKASSLFEAEARMDVGSRVSAIGAR